MERVFLDDLVPVGVVTDKDLLFAKKEDLKDVEQPLFCIRVFCDNSMSYGFGIGQKFAKFLPVESIDQTNEVAIQYYHDRIGKTFNGDAIFQMMSDFLEEYEKMQNLDNKWLYDFTQVKTLNNEQ